MERTPSPQRSQSQPPSGRKSVQFAEKPEFSPLAPTQSEASDLEHRHHRHKRSQLRGYEAGDDTDSTPDEFRRSSREYSSQSRNLDGDGQDRRKHHRRRRSHDPSTYRRGDEPSSTSGSTRGKAAPDLERVTSPADSDATIELPPRFDDKGRRKTDEGDDPLADKVDEILAGKGAAGKMFGNFLDGLFGPDGRRKKGR